MTDIELKRRVDRLRSRAQKVGCRVEKSRVKNTHSNNQGGYRLIRVPNHVIDGVKFEMIVNQLEVSIKRVEGGK